MAAEPIKTPECREVVVILRPGCHAITDQLQTNASGYESECARSSVWEYGRRYGCGSTMIIRLYIVSTSVGAFIVREFDSQCLARRVYDLDYGKYCIQIEKRGQNVEQDIFATLRSTPKRVASW